MKRKIPYLTIVMIIGIINTYYFKDSFIYNAILLTLMLIILFKTLSKKKTGLLVFVFIYGLGAFLLIINIKGSTLSKFIDREVTIEGVVLDKKEIEKDINNYVVKSRKISYNNKEFKTNERTRIKIIGDYKVDSGDIIEFKSILREPMRNTNPKLYNYKQNLQSKKIYTISTIKTYQIVNHKKDKNILFQIKNNFQEKVVELFQSKLNIENSPLIISILLGDYKYLAEEDITSYRTLGIAHLLAVSGLHIGIIASFFIKMFSELGIKRKYTNIIVIIIIWLYSFLIGFPVSTLRACIMLSLVLIANNCVEPYDSVNNLFISMLILLIINPLYIFSLSFQLSYIASLSLIVITDYLKELIYPMKYKEIDLILPIVAVQIGLIPIQMYYFNEVSIIAIISNLLIVPLVSIGLIIAFIMIIFSYTVKFPNNILGFILDTILSGAKTLTTLFSKIPFSSISFRSPDLWEIGGYYLLIMILLKIINISNISKKMQRLAIFCSIIIIMSINIISLFDNALYLDFIDVGQGDSILIRYRNNNYLVDTGGEALGSFKIGENITLPYLRKHGYNYINGLFITHFHDDHSKAAPLIIEELKVGNILSSYNNKDNATYKAIEKLNRDIHILKKGDKIKLGKDLNLKVVSPTEHMITKEYSENNKSLVLLLEYLDFKILLTGDIEKEVESYLLKDDSLKNLDIIKVAHHGSITSSGEEFIQHIKPKNAIFTLGKNNLFGHPDIEVIKRYKNMNTSIYRTDEMGQIRVKISKRGIKIDPFLTEKRIKNKIN